jgi:hypothetical protein
MQRTSRDGVEVWPDLQRVVVRSAEPRKGGGIRAGDRFCGEAIPYRRGAFASWVNSTVLTERSGAEVIGIWVHEELMSALQTQVNKIALESGL